MCVCICWCGSWHTLRSRKWNYSETTVFLTDWDMLSAFYHCTVLVPLCLGGGGHLYSRYLPNFHQNCAHGRNSTTGQRKICFWFSGSFVHNEFFPLSLQHWQIHISYPLEWVLNLSELSQCHIFNLHYNLNVKKLIVILYFELTPVIFELCNLLMSGVKCVRFKGVLASDLKALLNVPSFGI